MNDKSNSRISDFACFAVGIRQRRIACRHVIAVAALAWIVAASHSLAFAQIGELFGFQYNANATSNYPDGAVPMAELIQGADGNYYTTTNIGGAGACPSTTQGLVQGCGAVVKISATGALSVVYSFPYDANNQTAPNGLQPVAGLIQGPDGNFYGITSLGGGSTPICNAGAGIVDGCGTVFKLTPAGKFTLLHVFCGSNGCNGHPPDGSLPAGRLIKGPNKFFYGTTQYGGASQGIVYNSGIIFEISPTGAYKVVHVFTGNPDDGANPTAGLILASDGNFYGTTESGGASGFGTVFKMTPAGAVTILHSFSNRDSNGELPMGALVEASDGNLYGTCYAGGANGVGTAFRISKSGSLQKIYDFTTVAGNVGYSPRAGLIEASDGNLYGTASEGGAVGQGTIYQLTLSGSATQVASFDPPVTGSSPLDAVLQGSDGRLYVTLQNNGGSNPDGVQDQGAISVVNDFLPPPPPSILGFSPTKGAAGAKVTVQGSAFVGATAVAFNGTSATFTVNGSGFITAIVPAGATTGPITVTTRGGKATSKKSFTVL